jgi:acetyl-CoA carboxylase carboxyltransferase component
MVAAMHAKGTALKTAPFLSIDDVIDPMHTRRWLVDGLVTARQQRGTDAPGPVEQPMF